MEGHRASSVRSSAWDLLSLVLCPAGSIGFGFPEGTLTLTDVAGGTSERRTIQAAHHKDCVDPLLTWLEQKIKITDLLSILRVMEVIQRMKGLSAPCEADLDSTYEHLITLWTSGVRDYHAMLSDYLTANSIFVAVIGLILSREPLALSFTVLIVLLCVFGILLCSKWRSSSVVCQVRMRYGSGD